LTNNTCAALGYFDGVHLGHKEVIKIALGLTQYEPVVFTFKSRESCNITADCTKHKKINELGIKRIFSYDFEEIKNFSPEEFVTEILVRKLNAGAVCCGYDFRFGRGGKADTDELTRICEKSGLVTVVVPPVELDGVPVSSTLIRELIIKGDMEAVNKFLGCELTYELEVVGGNRVGRTIGFPTINQNIPKNCVIPRFGVYGSRVTVKDGVYSGITNIGVKPTAGENRAAAIETHIIDYDGDLYGKTIKVSLLKFIRPEKKFNNFTELSNQIKEDLTWLK
jgi:riboflavin kinase/FMN adenylyltransferase